MSVTVTVRVPDGTVALIEASAAARGMTRSEWLGHVIDRGLVGAGVLHSDDAAARSAGRRARAQANAAAVAAAEARVLERADRIRSGHARR